MKPLTLPKIVFCLLSLLFFTPDSFAQPPTGGISGTVTDSAGASVPGAVITLKRKSQKTGSIANGFIRTVESNDAGEYKSENLQPGTYEIEARNQVIGLSYRNEEVFISGNESTKLDIRLTYGAECEKTDGQPLELSDADKAEIVNRILEDTFLENRIAGYELLIEKQRTIVLSTENIKADWVKPLKNGGLKLMNESEIREKGENKVDFPYLSFEKFQIKGKCVVISLSYSRAIPQAFGSAGINYLYHKEAGKLIGKSIGGWVS